jgi:hypothetical protein
MHRVQPSPNRQRPLRDGPAIHGPLILAETPHGRGMVLFRKDLGHPDEFVIEVTRTMRT